MRGDAATEMLSRKSLSCRDFDRISTLRATAPKEAWLAIEKGPYLLGFSQLAGDWQNHQHVSAARVHHAKMPYLQVFMEPTGIEPVTSCLQSRRSPS